MPLPASNTVLKDSPQTRWSLLLELSTVLSFNKKRELNSSHISDQTGNVCAQVLLLLDADFIASAGLHEFLTRDDKAADLMEDLVANRKVIVLPAFETEASLGVDGGGEMALKAQASACSCPSSHSHHRMPIITSSHAHHHILIITCLCEAPDVRHLHCVSCSYSSVPKPVRPCSCQLR